MHLTDWHPFSDLDTLFDRYRGGPMSMPTEKTQAAAWRPAAAISETPEAYIVRADLPSVKKEDIQIQLNQGLLTLTGSRKHEAREAGEQFHRIEMHHGTFTRSFQLPKDVDTGAIRAESKDGVLTITLPKLARATPESVQIDIS